MISRMRSGDDSPHSDPAVRGYRLGHHTERSANSAPLLPEGVQSDLSLGIPFSNDAQVTLTDFYQLTMMYAYWKCGRHQCPATFDVYFRKNPFKGEFAVFAGLNEVLRFINSLTFTEDQLEYISTVIPQAEPDFFEYLRGVSGKSLTIHAIREGSVVFPSEPLLRVEGPLAICQLIETPLLNLLNFPTLVATNAARYRLAAGWDKDLFEFGARRAQGPDGAVSASRYSYLGGFDGTSNVRAGHLFQIPIKGTHSHSFVTSFETFTRLPNSGLECNGVSCPDFVERVLAKRQLIVNFWPRLEAVMHRGELLAFATFAQAFPRTCICLVDTYDTLSSGVPNFLCVALALHELGIKPGGVRLDSGDLAYLSVRTRKMFCEIGKEFGVPELGSMKIVVSNDINEEVLLALHDQEHSIDSFGIGTNLVTCQAQPALGMVYKLAEIDGRPCMKLSQEIAKMSIPARKDVYRLYSKTGEALLDLITFADETPPKEHERIFCRHLFNANKRCYVVPERVERLLELCWKEGVCLINESLVVVRSRCVAQLHNLRSDYSRPINPTPYKVSASTKFYEFFGRLWEETAPVFTLE